MDRVLIETVRRHDDAVLEPRRVKHLPRLLRQVREVTGIEADALQALAHRHQHLLRHADRIRHAGRQHIVGVDEQHRIIRINLREALKRRVLVIVVHHPAVRHRPAHRNAEHLPGQHRRRTCGTANVGGPGTIHRGVNIVRPPRAEVRHQPALCRTNDPVRLRRDEGLVIHLCENRGLHQLCVDERCLHREDRLVRVHDAALRQRPHRAAEAEIPQPREEILRINMQRAKVVDIRIIEVHPLEVVQHLLEPREDREARTIRILPVEHVEGHQILRSRILEITVRHRHLIEIHHHGNIPLITLIHAKSFLYGVCPHPIETASHSFSLIAQHRFLQKAMPYSRMFFRSSFRRYS